MSRRLAAAAAVAVLLVSLASVAHATEDTTVNLWAVLIAGSNGFWNYRHQADLCHAYQILHKHGVPDSQIITFMYDDIANNTQNPDKGVIINRPNGPNVYPGVPKDYTGLETTAANLLDVLQGKDMGAGKKTLKSGPNDYVFVAFFDHGADGLVAMPVGDYLYAKDLYGALTTMHKQNMYKQLVFYMEACESGSMFNGILPNDMNIYATTAANPSEPSYACYYDAQLNTYLGDCYSVNWMENTDAADLNTETLEQQYTAVAQRTNTSHVCQYGQLTWDSEDIALFFSALGASRGASSSPSISSSTTTAPYQQQHHEQQQQHEQHAAHPKNPHIVPHHTNGRKHRTAVHLADAAAPLSHSMMEEYMSSPIPATYGFASSRDAELLFYAAKSDSARTLEEKAHWSRMEHTEMKRRARADRVFGDLAGAFALDISDMPQALGDTVWEANTCSASASGVVHNHLHIEQCLKHTVAAYENACGRFTDYSLQYVRYLAAACSAGHSADTIAQATANFCKLPM